MKNKRYIRLSKQMKAKCNGHCSGDDWICKYYRNCFHGYLLCPKQDSLRYLQLRLKGQNIINRKK